ncbi:MAG: lipid-binding protein [Flavobacteriales bacterium]|nr:lipid-binding protein [Flavobacteriales bacterium]|tara:strand:- start:2959 stop:3555 length:597 start_codon:yes stop_codon:yes gene_type:complete
MTFNFSAVKCYKQAVLLILTIGCFFILQSFTIEKEDIKIKDSALTWVGSKITGSHEGTINLKSGYLTFDNKNLVGGEFVIDMTTIVCTDLSGKGKASIESHLKSDDFFSVDNFPNASLKILNVKNKSFDQYQVNANITIKGFTQKIVFDAEIKEKTAKAKLIIDRTLFGIIYKSGNFFEELADKAIYDEFEMSIELTF